MAATSAPGRGPKRSAAHPPRSVPPREPVQPPATVRNREARSRPATLPSRPAVLVRATACRRSRARQPTAVLRLGEARPHPGDCLRPAGLCPPFHPRQAALDRRMSHFHPDPGPNLQHFRPGHPLFPHQPAYRCPDDRCSPPARHRPGHPPVESRRYRHPVSAPEARSDLAGYARPAAGRSPARTRCRRRARQRQQLHSAL